MTRLFGVVELWGACANVCAHGVERVCELSRRAQWSGASSLPCEYVCAGGVRERALSARLRASDTRLACVGGSQ